jgi:hypothetical protein
MYLLLGLFFIGFERNQILNKKSKIKFFFIILFILSISFQIVGSAINYQSIQMPLEYACKEKYGDNDMKWAHESRTQLMTYFSASLLLNNINILSGNIPIVLKNNLDKNTIRQFKKSYNSNSGPNDWFFYEIFSDSSSLTEDISNRDTFKVLFLLLIITIGATSYTLYKNFQKKES